MMMKYIGDHLMSFEPPKKYILSLLMILNTEVPTVGGILTLCTRQSQRDLRKSLELHQFGC